MAAFVIEGTVSELKMTDKQCFFKICGAEGFSVKQKHGKEYVKFNVLCPPSKTVEENKKPHLAILFDLEESFLLEKDVFSLD